LSHQQQYIAHNKNITFQQHTDVTTERQTYQHVYQAIRQFLQTINLDFGSGG